MEKIKTFGDTYDDATVESYYDAVGENNERIEKSEAEKLFDDLIPKILENKTVLDLGCGNGRYSEEFCEKGAKKVIALDLSESMMTAANKRKKENQLDKVDFIRADMDTLPLNKKDFDFIAAYFSLMYSKDLPNMMKKLADSLSENGEILIGVSMASSLNKDNLDLPTSPTPLILNIDNKQTNLKYFLHTMDEYLSAINNAGLNIILAKEIPTTDLSVDTDLSDKDNLKFSYGIFKLSK